VWTSGRPACAGRRLGWGRRAGAIAGIPTRLPSRTPSRPRPLPHPPDGRCAACANSHAGDDDRSAAALPSALRPGRKARRGRGAANPGPRFDRHRTLALRPAADAIPEGPRTVRLPRHPPPFGAPRQLAAPTASPDHPWGDGARRVPPPVYGPRHSGARPPAAAHRCQRLSGILPDVPPETACKSVLITKIIRTAPKKVPPERASCRL
jgi:hypothetical protein